MLVSKQPLISPCEIQVTRPGRVHLVATHNRFRVACNLVAADHKSWNAQRPGQASSKFGSQGSESAEVPASVRAHWEGAGLLAPSRTSRPASVGLAPGGPSAAGAALKAQSLDGGLLGLGAGAASQPPAASPAPPANGAPRSEAWILPSLLPFVVRGRAASLAFCRRRWGTFTEWHGRAEARASQDLLC